MSISNLTAIELLLDFQGDDVSLLDDYRRNYSGQDIWWEVGTRSDSCYTSTFDDLSIRALEPNARLTIAVRVASRDGRSPSDFRLTFNGKGLIKYARWTISLPVSASTSTSADTPINSLLTPGEIWTKNGLEIQLKSPTRLPGCDGLFGFELSVINASPNELLLDLVGEEILISDESSHVYALDEVWWRVGSQSDQCYSNSLSGLYVRAMKPGERFDVAIRVLGHAQSAPTSFKVRILSAGLITDAAWQIE